MPILRQGQGDSAKARPSRPNLTLETHPPSYPNADSPCAQSAPVGTRQEMGIAPMYQAGDRHCAKLAEMMDSPTWRSQDTVPHMGYANIQRPLPLNEDGAQAIRFHKKDTCHPVRVTGLPAQKKPHIGYPVGEVLHLGRYSDDIKILGIQPFSEIPDTPNNAFIISAAVSQGILRPYESFSRGTFGDGNSSDRESSTNSSLLSASSLSELQLVGQDKFQPLEYHAQKVMERDDAIQSINHNLRSLSRQHQVTSDEQQRFKGLLDRLHQRQPGESDKEAASFIDPAIISFVPKKTDLGTPTKRSTRNRSDSGYASPSVYSRPSTRAQSRICGAFGSGDSEVIRIEHQTAGSHDSGFDESPSKNSMLNPTAKEFSVPTIMRGSPNLKVTSIRPPASTSRVFVPSQQFQDMLGGPSAPQISPVQGAWYPPQANAISPLIEFASMQQAVIPEIMPQWNSITRVGISSAAGMSPHGLPAFPAPAPGLGQPPGVGLNGFAMSPGLRAANISGPFHQQLSNLGLCCNPAHQAMNGFSTPGFPGTVPPIMAPQTTGVSAPLAGLTPLAVPFVPKHVPKPKVPNTTGQQNWELMHELRRMNEPGYAQKCKEKQKKRYIKQLEKTSGQY